MFNFEEGKVNFNSVEEVKEFLSSTDDLNVLGALCFTDQSGDVEQEIPISLLIEEIGIDNVAELLFKLSEGAELMSFSRDEMIELLEKSERGEELTEEEQKKLNFIESTNLMSFPERRRQSLFNGITMTLYESKEYPLFSTVGGSLALASTYLECALITANEKLKRVFYNETTAHDVANLAASKIKIEEGTSPEMAILGLLHTLGDLATREEVIRELPLNFEGIVEALDLDEEWIFNPGEKVVKEAKQIEGFLEGLGDIREKLEELWDGSNEEVSEEKENGSNTDNLVDIRERLKRK